MDDFHEPVLLEEALKFLNVRPGEKYIDATVGGGGHTAAIIRQGGKVLGIDVDPEAVDFARERLAAKFKVQSSNFKVKKGNFREIEKIAKENDFYPVAGIIYDLGLSSHQLEHSGRGFSFQRDEPLDMRSDPTPPRIHGASPVTAADLVNGLTENELTKLFEKYGEEKYARAVAGGIIRSRWDSPIRGSKELADIVSQIVRRPPFAKASGGGVPRRHPATKVFQALRIAVNDELNNLKSSLPPAFELLEPASSAGKPGGRLVVISFHSLEDRIVKKFFKEMETERGKILTKKPVTPSEEEVERNPRSRSAKLRAVEKIRNPKFEAPNKS